MSQNTKGVPHYSSVAMAPPGKRHLLRITAARLARDSSKIYCADRGSEGFSAFGLALATCLESFVLSTLSVYLP